MQTISNTYKNIPTPFLTKLEISPSYLKEFSKRKERTKVIIKCIVATNQTLFSTTKKKEATHVHWIL